MNPAINRILNEACSAAEIGVQQFLDDYCDDMVKEAREHQRESDIKAAILAFIDLKLDDATIYDLLHEHFGLDSISEIKSFVIDARRTSQIICLRKHQEKAGMTPLAFRQYAKEHRLEEKLEADQKLLYIPPEKLKQRIEKASS